jgi:hypothetical protein
MTENSAAGSMDNGAQDPTLLVVLGAGASYPDIPGVAQLTDSLLAWSAYREPEVPTGRRGENEEMLEASAVEPLASRGASDKRAPFFGRLKEILGSSRDDLGKHLNFEDLIQACDELARALPREVDREDRSRWMLEPFFELKAKHGAWGQPRMPLAMSLLAEEARYFMLETVGKRCETTKGPLGVYEGLKRLADRCLLRIHSLNYDDLVQQSGLDCYTGFDPQTGEFKPSFPWPERQHSLAQLHGSVRWGWGREGEIRAFGSVAEARPARNWANDHGTAQGRSHTGAPLWNLSPRPSGASPEHASVAHSGLRIQ